MPRGVRVSREVLRGFWTGLRAGSSPSQAAVAVGASDSAGRRWIINAGGVMERRTIPSGFRLTLADRRSIENGCRAGLSLTVIAAVIGKSPSTVSREVGGKAGRAGYRADSAQLRAEDLARRPKQTKLEANPALRERVAADLGALLSPEQIAGQLRREFPEDPECRCTHETIYRRCTCRAAVSCAASCPVPAQGEPPRRAGRPTTANGGAGSRDMVIIRERPAEVEDGRCRDTGRAT